MAITFPLTPPALPRSARAALRIMTEVGMSKNPFTLQTQAQVYDGEGWGLEITFPPMERPTGAPWIAFLAALRGPANNFTYGPPLCAQPLGVPVGSPVVDGAHAKGS